MYGSILPSRSYNKIKDILLKDVLGSFLLYDGSGRAQRRQNKTNKKNYVEVPVVGSLFTE